MQLRSLFAKRVAVAAIALLCAMTLAAQHRYRSGSGVNHYLTLQLGAGEGNTLATSEKIDLKNLGGANAQFAFSYEIRKNFFFFNFGGGVQYAYTGQGCDYFMDSFAAATYQGVKHEYRYHYRNFEERQHTLLVGMPIQFGFYLIPQFFIAVGARAEYPLLALYRTNTMLMTDGMFPQFIEPFQNNAQYAFYPETPYATRGHYMALGMQPTVSPTLELGTRFRLGGPVSMRLGVYAEYAIPLLQQRLLPLTDYSLVDTNPYTHNQQNLWTMLRINSVLDHNPQKRDYSRLSVGVRMTILFNLKSKPQCTTCDDDSGVVYSQPKKIRRTNSTKIRLW